MTDEIELKLNLTPEAADALLAQPLLQFLSTISGSGLGTWAAQQPARAAPTLGEVALALRTLKSEVRPNGSIAYHNSAGEPVHDWGAFFDDLRHPRQKSTLHEAEAKALAGPFARPAKVAPIKKPR